MKKRLKFDLLTNTGGVWGNDPDGVNDTIVLRSTDQTVDGAWRVTEPAVRAIEPSERVQYRLKAGDILVTKSSGSDDHIGKASLVTDEIEQMQAVFSNFNQRLRLKEDRDPRFYWYLLNSRLARHHYLVNANSTSGLGNLNADIIGNLPIPDLSLETQRRIADFLDRETARIARVVDRQLQLLKLITEKQETTIAHAVGGGLSPNVQRGASTVEWLPSVPVHWPIVSLKRVARLQTGPFGSQLHASDYVEGGIPLVNPAQIRGGRVVPNPSVSVDRQTFDRLRRHGLKSGDIVFARRGEMGRAALVTDNEDGFLCGTGSIRVRPTNDVVPDYLYWALTMKGVREHLLLQSVGSTMDNLNTEILGETRLPLPPREDQVAIVEELRCVSKIFRKVHRKTVASIDKLHELRATLITKAVTGQIDPAKL